MTDDYTTDDAGILEPTIINLDRLEEIVQKFEHAVARYERATQTFNQGVTRMPSSVRMRY